MRKTMIAAIVIIIVATLAIAAVTSTKKSNSNTSGDQSPSTTLSDNVVTAKGEILCYNPQTQEVGDGVAVFTRSNPREAEAFYLYLMGIEEPNKIEVKDWQCVSKDYVDSGLVRLTLFNENSSFWAVKEGYVFYDGQEIVKLLDDTEY